ncbi:RNA polymerase sigma-70 factor [Sphingobacterium kyonggiense]|uniref:RNA polymerase sigma-70 factor n=1 Tax=Sphingobacterium kyonggiense TaxID=714075 RepID=A0ABP7Y7T2_9SPHI
MAKQETDKYIQQWLKGDEQAFRHVVDGYFHQMSAFALQMVQHPEDAEELVMNAFLRLWQHKHRIVYVSRPEEYLFGILRREIVAHARKRVLLTEPLDNIEPEDLGTVAHPELGMQELRSKYQAALDKLTPRQKMVFRLSREQDLSQQQIADNTGLSVNTVGNHMNAALKVFREEFKECPSALLLFACSSLTALFL